MVGLVLLNLVFVQLTEAASVAWLVPLYVLTLTSSLFARFKEEFLYRTLWNVGVLAFFAVLVGHALSANLASVLQDGLTLAVLCQVHLLNNLHRNQRPDILFINSYLVAIITGYITVDLGFAGAFLAYVPFYVLGLQYLAVFRPDARLTAAEVKAVAFDGAKRTAVLLGLALMAFVFWPRDFQREALLSRYFEFDASDAPAEVDFSESLELGERGAGGPDQGRLVMTITPFGAWPVQSVLPDLWRGTTLDQHLRDGSWAREKAPAAKVLTGDWPWEMGATGNDQSSVHRGAAEHQAGPRVLVVRKGGGSQVLFVPCQASAVTLASIHSQGVLQTEGDGTLRYSNPGEVRYEMTLADVPSKGEPDQDAFLRLSPSVHTKAAAELAALLRPQLKPDASPSRVADHFTAYLRRSYPYRLPHGGSGGGTDDEPEPAGTLHEFLTSQKGGHCEFFASALATMLRSEGISARVVTGFRVGAPDPESGVWTVRSTSAHAWVEAFTEGTWRTLDPTPAASLDAAGESWLAQANAALTELWTRVTSFDAESRALVTAWLKSVPGNLAATCAAHPILSSALSALLALALFLRRKARIARVPASIRTLRRAMKGAKVAASGGETPREVLARVERSDGVDVEALGALRRAVEAHEHERFSASRS